MFANILLKCRLSTVTRYSCLEFKILRSCMDKIKLVYWIFHHGKHGAAINWIIKERRRKENRRYTQFIHIAFGYVIMHESNVVFYLIKIIKVFNCLKGYRVILTLLWRNNSSKLILWPPLLTIDDLPPSFSSSSADSKIAPPPSSYPAVSKIDPPSLFSCWQ